MKEIHDLLSEHPFTQGLEEDILELIAGCAHMQVFQAGDYVFREGEAANHFHLIRHGTIALELHAPGSGPLTFQTIKSGEMLGAAWLVPPYRWSFDARAVELTRTVAFQCACLRTKCEEDHHVGYELMKRFIPPLLSRLQMARMQGADLYAVPDK